MRVIYKWAARCSVIALFVFSLPASAHLVFTYTSDELPLTSYSINGELDDLANHTDILPIAFTFSFTAPEQDLSLNPSTKFSFKNFTFSLISPEGLIEFPLDLFSERSGGWVNLDSAGNVLEWNVLLRITELITPDTDLILHRLARHFVALKTNSETGEDKFTNRFHPVEWESRWVQGEKIQQSYSGGNDAGNWSITKVDVPEPGVAGLLLAGVLGLFWSRRERNLGGAVKPC
ncbi:PEP-CTERM sorting domain-containing protein [Cellvibrio mixtus]|uniref:PEP-CTERM sorting domain-containing protein n=1 Tax=Cellvibrio mixtus TaxID=39650 RepID=UPI0005879B34|nr:PEP-CTERM sorting domain-containing protein [Cellvibrio mixtus]